MITLSLFRKESEPIRESYFRTYSYFIVGNQLYRKRYSWGRISEDRTERLILSDANLKWIQDLICEHKLDQNRKSIDKLLGTGDMSVRYVLDIASGPKSSRQVYAAPSHRFGDEYTGVNKLWRMLEGAKEFREYSQLNTFGGVPEWEFTLEIKEQTRNRDSETRIRTYRLDGPYLSFRCEQKGRFRDIVDDKVTLEKFQLSRMYASFEDGLKIWRKVRVKSSNRKDLFDPYLAISYNGIAQGVSSSFSLEGYKSNLVVQLPFLALELFENHLKTGLEKSPCLLP